MPKKALKEVWNVDGIDIPVRIYKEWRSSHRISITRDKVIMRVPVTGASAAMSSYRKWATKWLNLQFAQDPNLLSRFIGKTYHSGYEIILPEKKYVLRLSRADRKTSAGKIKGTDIILKLSDKISALEESKTIVSLCSRLIGQDNQKEVENRIRELNDQYFQEEIKSVRIKNNSSNWGSCSSSGNINISVKTLFAPAPVRDYVYIHELAHLKELNHSPRYWSIVQSVMPEYKKYERWLKTNGHLCQI